MEGRRNLVVYWKGGGYDGCIWEPNMGFFGREGEWHPVVSTGSGALDTAEDVEAELARESDPEVDDWRKSGIRTFPIEGDGDDCLGWLCEHVRNDYVATLADALVGEGYSPRMTCTRCGRRFSSLDSSFSDISREMERSGFYRGDGGVGIVCDEMWCDDCRGECQCGSCWEVTEPDRYGFEARFWWDWLRICEGCSDTLRGRLREALGDEYDERMSGLEDSVDGMGRELDRYLDALRKGNGTPEERLAELRREHEASFDVRRKALVDEMRDWLEPVVRERGRLDDPSDLLSDRMS